MGALARPGLFFGFVFVVVLALLVIAGPAFAQEAAAASASPAIAWAPLLPIAWFVLTAVVNSIAHVATPDDVDAWAERQPRLAQFFSVLRRFGVEPIAGVKALYGFFAGSPPPPGHAAAVGKLPAPPAGPSRGFARLFAMVLLAVLALLVAACGILASAPDAASFGLCEAGIAQAQPRLTFAEFVAASLAKCGAKGGALVLDVLDALLASRDPALAKYKDEAMATKASPARLGSLRAQVGHP